MNKAEIIKKLKECNGDRGAIDFAIKFIHGYATCENCKFNGRPLSEDPCSNCDDFELGCWEEK